MMYMIDITSYIREYRGTIIPLRQSPAPYKARKYDWDLCDGFADICERLFLLIVLRPNGIFGITKSKQYDKMPAGIPSLIAVPVPDARESLVAENYVRAGIAESFTNKHHYYNK